MSWESCCGRCTVRGVCGALLQAYVAGGGSCKVLFRGICSKMVEPLDGKGRWYCAIVQVPAVDH